MRAKIGEIYGPIGLSVVDCDMMSWRSIERIASKMAVDASLEKKSVFFVHLLPVSDKGVQIPVRTTNTERFLSEGIGKLVKETADKHKHTVSLDMIPGRPGLCYVLLLVESDDKE